MSARVQRVEDKNGSAVGEALLTRIAQLERENTALREQVEHLIGMIEQLEGDLAHFATVEAFEGKKEVSREK